MKPIVFLSLTALFLTACGRTERLVYDDAPAAERNSIAYLKSLCRSDLHRIAQPCTVVGLVTADDLFQEYDRSIVVEDATGGIEVAVDLAAPRLAAAYPVGSTVEIGCNGLALGNRSGTIVLGMPPTGTEAVEPLPAAEAGRFIRRLEAEPAAPVPTRIGRFGELSPRLISSFVRFDGVRFARDEVGEPFCMRDEETGRYLTTERHLIDGASDTIRVRILGGCDYRAEPVPRGTGSVCGILEFFDRNYQLRIVRHDLLFGPTAATPPRACLSDGIR